MNELFTYVPNLVSYLNNSDMIKLNEISLGGLCLYGQKEMDKT
jgi:hypothetical protein